MNHKIPAAAAFVVLAGLLAVRLFKNGDKPQADALHTARTPAVESRKAAESAPANDPLSETQGQDAPAGEQAPLTEEERHKEIDRENLKKLHGGLFAYKAKYGVWPEYLSQLVPEFVSAEALVSPRGKGQGMNYILAGDHPDPGVKEPSYGYEFSNLEFRDGRTFAEIKEIQRTEWGDVIPVLRAFGYDKVLNMSYGGDVYETQLNWEWDPATLDMVEKYGWGPGLKAGETVKVQVTRPDGQPLANAEVWADGRSYSFSLPERPYLTNSNGFVQIPVGSDLDRTALNLRLSAPGFAAEAVRYPLGEVPESHTLTAVPAQTIGGRLLDAEGNPLANTRLLLTGEAAADGSAATVAAARTDENGNWTAQVRAEDAPRLSVKPVAALNLPDAIHPLPLDPAAALQRSAVITLPKRGGR